MISIQKQSGSSQQIRGNAAQSGDLSTPLIAMGLSSSLLGLVGVLTSHSWGLLGLGLGIGLTCLWGYKKMSFAKSLESTLVDIEATQAKLEQRLSESQNQTIQLSRELETVRTDLARAKAKKPELTGPEYVELCELRQLKESHETNHLSNSKLFIELAQQVNVAIKETEAAVDSAITSFFSVADQAGDLAKFARDGLGSETEKSNMRAGNVAEGVVSALVQRMRADARSMEQCAAESAHLVAIGSELEEILSQIEKVSDRTSMLSLNAQIEAARAGVNGRAFMIVAEEVRKLSLESKEAAERTRKISQQMTAVSNKTADRLHSASLDSTAAAHDAESQVRAMLASIHELDALKEAKLDELAEKGTSIGNHIARITMALQFQDMLRQRLEHVSAPLVALAEGVQPEDVWNVSLQSAPGAAPALEVVAYGSGTTEDDIVLF